MTKEDLEIEVKRLKKLLEAYEVEIDDLKVKINYFKNAWEVIEKRDNLNDKEKFIPMILLKGEKEGDVGNQAGCWYSDIEDAKKFLERYGKGYGKCAQRLWTIYKLTPVFRYVKKSNDKS